MNPDVLFINPNRMKPAIAPLALEYLAQALEHARLTPSLCDLCFALDPAAAVAAALAEHSPRLIALTMRNADDCYCATRHSFVPDCAALIETIRQHSDAPVVLGGAGYSTAPTGLLRRTGADFGTVGDGERPLVQLALALRDHQPTDAIPGLVWQADGDYHLNLPSWQPFGQSPLSRTFTDNTRYFREGGQAGLETQRGCPGRCVYCADPLSKGCHSRFRPAGAIIAEVRNLLALGVDAIHLCDSEFNLSYDHATAVCHALIDAGLGDRFRWWGYLAPVPFDAGLLDLMVRAGCAGINFGADSGDDTMLRRLGRTHIATDLAETARLCRSRRLPFMFDLLLGGPGETRESLRRTIELMKQLRPTCVGVSLGMRLYRGSRAAEDLLRAGHFTPDNPHLQGHIVGNQDLSLPAYHLEGWLNADGIAFLRSLIAGDPRFFFGWPDGEQADYNYDDNQPLVDAIATGERGAYWDILRRQLGLDP